MDLWQVATAFKDIPVSDLLVSWVSPQGVIALGMIVGLVNSFINRRNIKKIELATNSMKDALVTATAAASRLEGRAEVDAEHAAARADAEAKRGDP